MPPVLTSDYWVSLPPIAWARRQPALRFIGHVLSQIGDHRISLMAGGVAFYAFLSVFPGLASALFFWGLFTDSRSLDAQLGVLEPVLPDAAFALIADQMSRIAMARTDGLTAGALISLVLALWSASRAINALLMAMSVTYAEKIDRGFLKQNAMALGFTLGAIVFGVISLAAISAVPPILDAIRLGAVTEAAIRVVRWLLIAGIAFFAILAFYRFARPSRRHAKSAPGAALATGIWLVASIGFSIYVASFGALNETFGSLGAVAALLMWFWITAFAICVGAETNAALKRTGHWRRKTSDLRR